MTVAELLIIKAALGLTARTTNIHDQAREIIEREIRMKELERTLNTKEGNEKYGR